MISSNNYIFFQDRNYYMRMGKNFCRSIYNNSLYYIASAALYVLDHKGAVKEVYKDCVNVLPTQNFAKGKDLPRYLAQDGTIPSHDIAKIKVIAAQFGLFCQNSKEIVISPVDYGKCFGAVAHFFRYAKDNGCVEALLEFQGGMPLSACYLQSLYTHFSQALIHSSMKKILTDAIESWQTNGPDIQVDLLISDWNREVGERIDIFFAVKEFLVEGGDPYDENFLSSIEEKLKMKGGSLGIYYATLRDISQEYGKKDLLILDSNRFAFFLAGLELDVVHHDVAPEIILQSLTHLNPGSYALSLSVFTPLGTKLGQHIIGFVIEEKNCFIFDPNLAGGKCDGELLSSIIKRKISLYTGNTLQTMGLFSRIICFGSNIVKRRPNPPLFGKIISGFSLYRLKALEI